MRTRAASSTTSCSPTAASRTSGSTARPPRGSSCSRRGAASAPCHDRVAMMITRRRVMLPVVALAALVAALWVGPRVNLSSGPPPATISDRAFWKMVTGFSEPGGYFRSDNLISNETTFQHVIPELKKRVPPGGAYIGVGPDQNFTYITALKPRI